MYQLLSILLSIINIINNCNKYINIWWREWRDQFQIIPKTKQEKRFQIY